MDPAGMYMGPAPVLPYRVTRARMVRDGEIVDTPPDLADEGLQASLRWMVAVVDCPYCDREHEHPMSQTAGWGWYTSRCDRARGYYLARE